MARPKKIGLEYYPKDTGSFNDRKIKRLLKAFGAKGYLVYDYLLSMIYSDKGYWIEWDEDIAFDIADTLGSGLTENLVKEVVNTSIKIGLFNASKFTEFKVLTSKGIQSRYKAAKRGKAVIAPKFNVIVTEIGVFDAETLVIDATSTQRKVKESKGKEIEKIYNLFVSEVKASNHAQAIEEIYMRLAIKKGSLTKLLKEFKGQLIIDEKLHESTLEFRKHFNNWLNVQDRNGLLKEYKKGKTAGAL